MFYVIGSENSKSGSAFYSSRQQNQRRGGAVRYFRCTDTVSDEPTYSIWSNSLFSCLCSGEPLCHYYTDNVICRQGCEVLSSYSEFQKAKFNQSRKNYLYLLGHLMKKNQRHKIRVNVARIISRKKFCPTWAEFSKSTSDQVGWKSETSLLFKLDRS